MSENTDFLKDLCFYFTVFITLSSRKSHISHKITGYGAYNQTVDYSMFPLE